MAAAVTGAAHRVVVARHAHAEWPGFQGSDFDRPLTPRGEQDAARSGAAMRAAGLVPVLALASPALRTSQTARIIARELKLPAEALRFVEPLYNASPCVLEAQLREAAQHTDGLLLLVAHNPGVSQLACALGDGTPTAAFAPAEWRVLTLR